MKLLSIFLISYFSLFTLQAQHTLSGKVKTNREELIGVTVWLTNNTTNKKIGTTSDIDSQYQFLNLPKGNYSLKATFVGYKEYNKQIQIQ